LVISDDAAVYENFTHSQKCWAHLLRKAIKLTLEDRDNAVYRAFADRLIEIYRSACKVKLDGRLGDAGRQRKVAELDDEIAELCLPMWSAELSKLEGPDDGRSAMLSSSRAFFTSRGSEFPYPFHAINRQTLRRGHSRS